MEAYKLRRDIDFPLLPLANSDTTLLDADNSDTLVNDSESFIALDPSEGLELAVDASSNGGSGGGGSGNVVCADMSDDDNGDDNDSSTNYWTREDYDLYVRVLRLINKHYDELDSEGESNMVGEIKHRVEFAWNACVYLGYRNSWAEYLPDRAELMLTRFVVPYDAIERSIAAMLGDMGRIRMLYIDG
ncbi:hypothetical protein B0J15DRAFT_541413 [Fusarium solani]|uniref:Uncharacterized protein n=1 Tax=Fusarium solani TaxID=169388 RepID=A0A9P9L3T2_FUSSL|nr:uncharacterized protein B0J15DRAFT_541413 [Fusarium solani]KAH7273453.1 hypothetical protein B0J15DRAFT_541413 [Fusarium solani]